MNSRAESTSQGSGPQNLAARHRSRHAADVEDLLATALNDAASRAWAGGTARTPRLGVDVVDTDILARQLSSRIGAEFTHRIFTDTEIVDCRGMVPKFATRWAVKEAVSKAIGTGFRDGLTPKAIEVLTAPDGSIRVAPSRGQRWPLDASTWRWTVSAAHEGRVAVAVVIALS
jgi:holo-[acyl-carrier protein] synthase